MYLDTNKKLALLHCVVMLLGMGALTVIYTVYNKQNPVQLHQVLGLSALILIVSSVTAWWLNKRYWLRIHQSHTDELTGLPTYWQFKAHIEQLVSGKDDPHAAILLLDIDRFKNTIRQQGYQFADDFLILVAEKLKKVLVQCQDINKQISLYRLEADRFTILVPDVKNCAGAIRLANRLLSETQQPFHINNREYFVSFSIGLGLLPSDGQDATALLRCTDVAMQQAKREGGNRYQLYSVESRLQPDSDPNIEGYLRHALKHNEFELYYQPKLNLKTGKVTGAEALLRWQHPEHGLMKPDSFIPIAEETGLIIPITEWILRTACDQNRLWQAQGLEGLTIAINISSKQFYQNNLPKLISNTLTETRLAAEFLQLEITESMMVHDLEETAILLATLKGLGIQLALDDFGTGFSSFAYLRHFPVDTIKIDQSFIRNLTTSAYDIAATRAMITLAHSLGLKIIAEGVETLPQMQCLLQEGCDEVQGHHIGEPMLAEDFKQLLVKHPKFF